MRVDEILAQGCGFGTSLSDRGIVMRFLGAEMGDVLNTL